MRILFISNFFPPLALGGYEEWCQEVALGMRRRGHETTVLTSRSRTPAEPGDPDWVRRELFLEMEIGTLRNSVNFFTQRKAREKENLETLRRFVTAERPDCIVIWGMWNLPRSLAALAESLLPDQTIYYMGDYWPTLPSQWRNYWQATPRGRLTAVPKLLLKAPALWMLSRESMPEVGLARVIFPTQFMRGEFARLGLTPADAPVIYGAIDTKQYAYRPAGSGRGDALRLLYVGRLAPEKGVHLAIEAMGILAREGAPGRRCLTIAGAGEPAYEAQLRELADRLRVSAEVELVGAQPKEALPGLYHDADVLLFTSIWAEPFGRTPVEAMASGLAVIGAPVGGAAELMVGEETALLFEPGDAPDLARQIARLAREPELRDRMTRRARELAVDRFDVERMTDEIESYLRLGLPGESHPLER